MKRFFTVLILILSLSFSLAQLPYSFTQLAHYDPDNYSEQGKAYDVAANDAYIFTAFGEAGISVHQLIDSNLVYVSHLLDGENHQSLLIAQDGSLLSAVTVGGVHAYSCEDGILVEQAILDTNIRTYRMVQGPDSTIFMANGNRGLFAYTYNGSQFDYITYIDQGGSARGIAYKSDSIVYLANYTDGIRVYSFDGESFSFKTHCLLSQDECPYYQANDITILNDSTIATCGSQINVYRSNGDSIYEIHGSFLPVTPWDPTNPYNHNIGTRIVCKENIVYVSVENMGLYSFDLNNRYSRQRVGARQETGHGIALRNNMVFYTDENFGISVYDEKGVLVDNYSMSDYAYRLRKGAGNTFYLASGVGGIKTLSFNNGNFEILNEVVTGENTIDIAVNQTETIVSVVNKYQGLKVYQNLSEKMSLIASREYHSTAGYETRTVSYFSTEISNDNKIYFGYYIKNDDMFHSWNDYSMGVIRSFTVNGVSISQDNESTYFDENHLYPLSICSGSDNKLFVALNNDGIKEFYNDIIRDDGGEVRSVTIGSEDAIYLANGYRGIRAYDFGSTFHEKAHVVDTGFANRIYDVDGPLLFLAHGNEGVRTYHHQDSIITQRAHYNSIGNCRDVIVLEDSTLIIADGYNGLLALSYNGWNDTLTYNDPDTGKIPNPDPIPGSITLYQNYPNPFNPSTTIDYKLPAKNNVKLRIFDLFGRKINEWNFQDQNAGVYYITWNGNDEYGNTVPSGVYIYTLVAGDHVESKKMVLLK